MDTQGDMCPPGQPRPRLNIISAAELLALDAGKLWASVSYCSGGTQFLNLRGETKPITRHIHATSAAAYAARASIDRLGCGGGCEEWHRVEEALPRERVNCAY